MRMDIVFASDDKYAPIMATAIMSIYKNKSEDDKIYIHILENDISIEKRNRILSLNNDNDFNIYFYDIRQYIKKVKQSGIVTFKGNYMTYARLFLDQCLDIHIQRVLYLDCDVMVQDSLEPLFSMDMHGSVAGVQDWVHMKYRKKIGLTENDIYINAGILLINLVEWRKNDIFHRICLLNKENGLKYHYADQDYLNIIFKGQIDVLPLRYCVFFPIYRWERQKILELAGMSEKDFYSEEEYKRAASAPSIIHMTGIIEGQPWKKGNISKERKQWMSYYEKTGMEKELLDFCEASSIHGFLFNRVLYRILPFVCWFTLYKKRHLVHVEEQIRGLE